jgi:hypothetical protein
MRVAAALVFISGGVGTALRMGSAAGSPEDVTASSNNRHTAPTTIVFDHGSADRTASASTDPRDDVITVPAPAVPAPEADAEVAPPALPATHTVQRGETLTEIARNDLTLRLGHAPTAAETETALRLWSEVNPIGDVNVILIGQDLVRPPVDAFAALAAPAADVAPATPTAPAAPALAAPVIDAPAATPEAAPMGASEATPAPVTVSAADPQLDTLGEIVKMDLIFRLGTRPTNGQLARAIRLWANVNDIDDPNLVFDGQALQPPTAEQLRWVGIAPVSPAGPTDMGISR